MSKIHQLYCTHCTHGNSALERRQGEAQDRVLGYSARAGSPSTNDLRRYYTQIERYIYYYLPRDATSEDKLRLTASSAPKRLLYLPSTAGLQILAQICYRQRDTGGRPGSYFAHVLFNDRRDGGTQWPQLDCLRLWGGASWVEEDSPDIEFDLDALDSLDTMLEGRPPSIDDGLLLRFLTTPANDDFGDLAAVIPPLGGHRRWQEMTAQQRQEQFALAFSGLLEIMGRPQESLLLVAEPGIAALMFYGMIRLLPPGKMRDAISFSTFEADTERVHTTLTATVFNNPWQNDLREEYYRSRGFTVNTFTGRHSESRNRNAQYAAVMVGKLVEQQWNEVDATLGAMALDKVQRVEDLEQLAGVDRLVSAVLDPGRSVQSQDWRSSAMATGYFRRTLGRKLSNLVDPAAQLKPLAGTSDHLLVLELIASGKGIEGTQRAVDYLLETLPADQIAPLLALKDIPPAYKARVLIRHVAAERRLPPDCDELWNVKAASKPGDPEPLLPRVMAKLGVRIAEEFYNNVSKQHPAGFMVCLQRACYLNDAMRPLLAKIAAALSDRTLLALGARYGADFFTRYPPNEPCLRKKLQAMLRSLPDHPEEFSKRLDTVLAGRMLLTDPFDQESVVHWKECRQSIIEIGELQNQKSRRWDSKLDESCRRMAEVAMLAMPRDRLADDNNGTEKTKYLRQIGKSLLGGQEFLPEQVLRNSNLWAKISGIFAGNIWSQIPLHKMGQHRRKPGRS